MMSERGSGRRTSARLAGKDDTCENNNYNIDPLKKSQVIIGGKQNKANSYGAVTKTGAKRKPSKCNRCNIRVACYTCKISQSKGHDVMRERGLMFLCSI